MQNLNNNDNETKYYKVKIKEVLKFVANEKANSISEAIQITKDKYYKGIYVLDASNFTRVSFSGFKDGYEGDEEMPEIYNSEMKKEAIERMKILNLNQDIIQEYKDSEIIYISQISGDLRRPNEDELELIKQLSAKRKIRIYHIVHLKTESKDILYFLYVDDKKANWRNEKRDLSLGYAVPIVYRKTIEIREQCIRIKEGRIYSIT